MRSEKLAEVFEPVVRGLLSGRGHVSLTAEQVIALGTAYEDEGIALAVHRDGVKYAGGYNAMDANLHTPLHHIAPRSPPPRTSLLNTYRNLLLTKNATA